MVILVILILLLWLISLIRIKNNVIGVAIKTPTQVIEWGFVFLVFEYFDYV